MPRASGTSAIKVSHPPLRNRLSLSSPAQTIRCSAAGVIKEDNGERHAEQRSAVQQARCLGQSLEGAGQDDD